MIGFREEERIERRGRVNNYQGFINYQEAGFHTNSNKVTYKDLLKSNVIANSSVLIDRRNISTKKILMGYKIHFDDYARWLNITRRHGSAMSLGIPHMLYFYSTHTDSSNKIKSFLRTWLVYRVSQKISLLESLYYIIHYALNGLKKHSKF